MKGWNSVAGHVAKNANEVGDALGITQFDTADVSKWAHTFGGLLIQGGLLSATGAVEFHAPYEKQVLGVFINGGEATDVSVTGFTSNAASYWWAIGV